MRERGFISSFRDKSAARHKVISHNGSSENWTATPVADYEYMGKYLTREKKEERKRKWVKPSWGRETKLVSLVLVYQHEPREDGSCRVLTVGSILAVSGRKLI